MFYVKLLRQPRRMVSHNAQTWDRLMEAGLASHELKWAEALDACQHHVSSPRGFLLYLRRQDLIDIYDGEQGAWALSDLPGGEDEGAVSVFDHRPKPTGELSTESLERELEEAYAAIGRLTVELSRARHV